MNNPNPAPSSITSKFADLEQQRNSRKNAPYLSNFFGTIYVAITTIMLAYGGLIGFGAILVMYALWLPKIVYKGVFLLRPTKDVIFVMLLPIVAIMSVAWSDYPSNTIKSAMEYASLLVCTVIISKTVRTEALLRGFVIGSTIALIASVASQQYGLDPLTGQYTLIGLFGSKNMIGLFAELGILFSLISLYVRQPMISKLIFAVGPLGICVVSLYLSKSASSVLTLALTLAVIIGARFITRLPRAMRTITLVGFTLIVLFVTVIGTMYDAQKLVLKSFGKDSTLTGRTYLWIEGYKSGMETPYFGHGYQAFWVEGRAKAEILWDKFGVPARIGFHFHDLYVETFVELGLFGVILIAAIMLITCWISLRCIIKKGMTVEYVYALSVSFLFFIRAIVEVDLIGTFIIGPVLFFSVIPKLATYHQEQALAKMQMHSGTG